MKKLAYSKPEITLQAIEVNSMLCGSPDNNKKGDGEDLITENPDGDDLVDDGFGDSHRRTFSTSW